MSSTAVTDQATKAPQDSAEACPNPYLRIAHAARASASPDSFYLEVLRIVAETLTSPYAAVSVRQGSEAIEHEHAADDTARDFWRRGVQPFVTEALTEATSRARMLDAKDGTDKLALLAAPLLDATGEKIGAIGLVTTRRGSADAVRKLAYLESLACFASFSSQLTEAAAPSRAAGPSAAAQATAHAASCDTPVELAFAITNNLRNKLGCEQVALGVAKRKWIDILAISGLDQVKKQSSGVRTVKAAMEECLDAGIVIMAPDGDSDTPSHAETGYRLHHQWRVAVKGDAVASIPLCIGDEPTAVLSLRNRPDKPFTEDQIEKIRAHVEPFASALRLLHNANRGPIRCTTEAAGAAARSMAAPGHLARKIVVGLIMAATAWAALGTMDYSLAVSAVVKPQETRHVTAPFDGVLAEAVVRAGDIVTRGDVLCRLDQEDMQQQRKEALAQINVFERKKDQALANDDPVSFQLALASQKLTRAKLETVNTRIERCTVRAPIDGIIVAGDLRKRLGSVVQLGDSLFEIAPLDALVLELEFPEADADDVAVDLSGSFASHARPEDTRPFRITRIHPRTEVRAKGNMCIVEASTNFADTWMRPGMEGVARVYVGRRRVWWIGFHRLLDYLRLNLWL